MPQEWRARPDGEVLQIATAAAKSAGVTRLSEVSQFAVPGIFVYQATRPLSRTLSVSQGKGVTRSAAMIGALLESVELWMTEQVGPGVCQAILAELDSQTVALWSDGIGPGKLSIDPAVSREWLAGRELASGAACMIPRELAALGDADSSDLPRSTVGLAIGNSREEALLSGLAEVIEHHCIAAFAVATPKQRRSRQIALSTIDDPAITRLVRLVQRAGFHLLAWNIGGAFELPVLQCSIFRRDDPIEQLPPVAGNGCHPDARTAFCRALLECVQTHATMVAGARDDIVMREYSHAQARIDAMLCATFAYGPGPLPWGKVPHYDCVSTQAGLTVLLDRARTVSTKPIVAYDHPPLIPGLHAVHVFAPGLRDDMRELSSRPAISPAPVRLAHSSSAATNGRRILFAGPSISGLHIPSGLELRPPAVCGDFASLLDAPPAAVALIDGCFKDGPTVWHKEILALMATGTQVIGGASLGALRAAELDRFGMVGIGTLYHACRSGVLVRDDAVMLLHAPREAAYLPLTVALVDAEHALFHADLPERTRRAMQRIVRTTRYEERSWTECLARYRRRHGADFPLTAQQLERVPSLKRADAALVVAALARTGTGPRTAAWEVHGFTEEFGNLLARLAPAFLAARI